MEDESDKSETECAIEILKGINFYYINTFPSETIICTFRNKQQVSKVFYGFFVSQLDDTDEILESFDKGIFCVELHNTYKCLEDLAKDIAVSKISGMMEKEI